MSLPQRKVAILFLWQKTSRLPCFGCGRGGNVFGFLQELEGLSFPESVLKVAEISDIPLDEQYKQTKQLMQPLLSKIN